MVKTIVLLSAAILLFAGFVLAAESEKDLRNAGQKIDQAAASPQGAEQVTQRLAETYNVPPSTIRDLKAQKLGYGEISILLALSKATGKSTSELLQRHKAGEGWGKIAKDEGVKLGPIISSVHRARPDFEEGGPRARGREEVGPRERPERPGGPAGAGPGGLGGQGMGRGRK